MYLKTIKESEEFVKILITLNIYFEFNIKVYDINYKTTTKNRDKSLTKFKNDNTCINILCNVHILDEGIDIPECDSVYLTHPNNNPINIIQRISRSNRIDKNNNDKIARIFIWSKNEIKLEQIINNLSTYIKINYGKEYNDIINNKNKNDNIIIDKNIEYKNNNYIITENFENNKIIIIIDNNNVIWFHAKQICTVLKYKQPKIAIINSVEKSDKIQLKNMGLNFKVKQQPDTNYINEKGLNSLLLTSRSREVKSFFEWVKNTIPLIK